MKIKNLSLVSFALSNEVELRPCDYECFDNMHDLYQALLSDIRELDNLTEVYVHAISQREKMEFAFFCVSKLQDIRIEPLHFDVLIAVYDWFNGRMNKEVLINSEKKILEDHQNAKKMDDINNALWSLWNALNFIKCGWKIDRDVIKAARWSRITDELKQAQYTFIVDQGNIFSNDLSAPSNPSVKSVNIKSE